ncbi:MAG: class I SAM-dependent methyltransferase [Desulfocurvibacter africanus]
MRFDEKQVRRYEAWFQTEPGRIALEREKALLEYLISPWPRRNQRLLEVGCGSGLFLEMFWQTGFDVSGIDPSPPMLAAARQRLGKAADLQVGHAECLPYEDKEFDFVALVTVLEFCDDAQAAIAEAVRVARKGVLIGFLNRRSLYYLTNGKCWPWTDCQGPLRNARWRTWPEIWDAFMSVAGLRPSRARSVLPGPPWSWRDRALCRLLNGILYPPGLGAFAAVRFDLVGEKPLTPIMVWKVEPRAS